MRVSDWEYDKPGESETVGQVTISWAQFNCVRWQERMKKDIEERGHPRVG